MDTLNSILEFILRPFVGWLILASIVGQVMKTLVFTRERACAGKGFWYWGRKTLPLHPVFLGVIIGLVWPGEIDGPRWVGGTLKGVGYFALAGACSVWGYEVVKTLLKKYEGIDLGALPGESDKPPSGGNEPAVSAPAPKVPTVDDTPTAPNNTANP